jgi:hypothetical protein
LNQNAGEPLFSLQDYFVLRIVLCAKKFPQPEMQMLKICSVNFPNVNEALRTVYLAGRLARHTCYPDWGGKRCRDGKRQLKPVVINHLCDEFGIALLVLPR